MTDFGEGVAIRGAGAALTLSMAAPRANALTPELLGALGRALDAVEARAPEALMIVGGRNFCSGGDVGRFHAAACAGAAHAYARDVVPPLHDLLMRLVALPCSVGVAARGAITGGGAGFLFAADCAVLAPDAFVQPYYGRVGFAPDGGWSALLPERIGAGAALAWLVDDRRMDAAELREAGLAAEVAAVPEAALAARIARSDPGTRAAARGLIWDAARRAAIRTRLDAETEAFLARITAPEVTQRMAAFLNATRAGPHV